MRRPSTLALFLLVASLPGGASAYNVEHNNDAMKIVAKVLNRCAIPNNQNADDKFICDCVQSKNLNLFGTIEQTPYGSRDVSINTVNTILSDCQQQMEATKAQREDPAFAPPPVPHDEAPVEKAAEPAKAQTPAMDMPPLPE